VSLTNLPGIRRNLKITIAGAALASALILAGPGSTAAACPYGGLSPAGLTTEQAELSVTCLVNKARRHNGVRRLTSDPRLQSAAKGHSVAMDSSNFFSHGGDGSPVDRARAAGYLAGASSWMVGENLHWGVGGKGTPKATVRRWLTSPGHRQAMLARRFRNIGVGVVMGAPVSGSVSNSAIYTADFGLSR
jgi:uncharacterized protein YkwD